MDTMSWSPFRIRVPGKWVLAGEHSVLHGAIALALPHPEVGLTLSFEPREASHLEVEPDAAGPLMRDLLKSIQEIWMLEDRPFSAPSGKLQIESTIPIGAGLGSSAALCVALTHWISNPLMIPKVQLTDFATQLEHRFHGRSSGMDVAVIAAGQPISFGMEQGTQFIGVRKLPKFTFHDTGLRSRTSECVFQVEKFRKDTPSLGVRVDESMSTASRLAMEGLILYDGGDEDRGLGLIQKAMVQARECFYAWGLVPGDVQRMEQNLLNQGALGVKMTGAGGGGMLVALWGESE